jgi:protein-L-isoaspartate O-methyltransferase
MNKDYPLGYSPQEAKRLADQAAVLEGLTEDVLRRAGLRPGMQILDIGTGLGDVALTAAKIVGSDGGVVGIDKAASSLDTARSRIKSLGIHNIHFEQSDMVAFTTDRKFDAIVGRCVLLYIHDRARVLRKLTELLNPGGIVALLEPDLSQIAEVPPSDLFTQVRRWTFEGFAAGGADLDMGSKLYATFMQAGLPAPNLIASQVVCGPTFPAYEHLVQALRSLLPMIEKHGIASAAEINIATLAERLREDAVTNHRIMFLSRFIGAWTQVA